MTDVTGPTVRIVQLRPDAIVPGYQTDDAAGLDLAAAIDRPIELAPGARAAIGTGLAMELPRGFEGQVRPRSGRAREHGVTVLNAPGTIDADFRGEIVVLLVNLGQAVAVIEPRDRIAQLVIAPVVQARIEVVATLSTTARGAGGFGSTGR